MINEIRWDITGKCNLKCRHCQASLYYENERKKGNQDLSLDEVKIVIDKIKMSGVKKIGILGGEPMMRNDLIEILKYMNKADLKISLNTNLTLLDKFDVNEIIDLCEAIYVSIDGTNEHEHDLLRGNGVLKKTLNNLEKVIAIKGSKPVNISYVLNKYNYKSSDKLYNMVSKLGIDTCFVDVVHKVGNADKYWDDIGLSIEEEIYAVEKIVKNWDWDSDTTLNLRMNTNKFRDYLLKKTGVKLMDKLVWDAPGKTSFYILNDGTMLPTHFLAYMDYEKGFLSKSLVNSSFDEIINTPTFKEFMSLYDKNLPQEYYESCSKCEYCGKQCNPSPVSYWMGKSIPMEFCLI